jgi:aspartyl-tRNA(Asn)/glutamyl-tRNA(Gln) amidotransferase subunit B
MAREDYEVVIGLEVHAELSTKTKIFCNCSTEFGGMPNTHTCPICMAMPGTLPVLNEKAVEYAVKAGLATNCSISKDSKNDRKNYFYPDLPKSYQISQFDKPLCNNGYIEIEEENGEKKKIRILRIHIEEDAGKLNHNEFSEGSLVDLNRAGVPLIEIVSEPDLRSAKEADAYLKKLKSTLEYIEVSDCKMQEGSFRADVNVSIHKPGTPFGTRTEMKNMNSFNIREMSDKIQLATAFAFLHIFSASSNKFDKYLEAVSNLASFSDSLYSSMYLDFLLSGNSGSVFLIFSIYSSDNFIATKSGSGKYL